MWLDEDQKLVSNRLAQEFKDYQIQSQFHSNHATLHRKVDKTISKVISNMKNFNNVF